MFGRFSPIWCCLEKWSGLNRISHPDWVKICVDPSGQINAPNKKFFLLQGYTRVFHNELELQSMVWKSTNSLVKKKFRSQQSLKKVTQIIFCFIKRLITVDFLEKGETINNLSCCQLFRQNSPYLLNDCCITADISKGCYS